MIIPQYLFAIPLILVFSLVYAGTRHEKAAPILRHAGRFALSIFLFLIAIGLVFEFLLRFVKG